MEHRVGGWPCRWVRGISKPWEALVPTTHPAPPLSRYQHLSAAYSPITTETQRERQKGLTRQVFEQDASGDEKSGLEDAVREPRVGGHHRGMCVDSGPRLFGK